MVLSVTNNFLHLTKDFNKVILEIENERKARMEAEFAVPNTQSQIIPDYNE